MKKLFFLFVSCLILQVSSLYAQGGYNIKVTVPNMPNKQLLLAYYFEGKTWKADSVQLNDSGYGVFKGVDKKLARGVYLLLFSRSNYFDIVIGDNQDFSIKTDTLDILQNIRFQNSPENQAFVDFQQFMISKNRKSQQLSEAFKKESYQKLPEIKKKYSEQLDQVNQDVRAYIANVCEQYPGSVLATLINFNQSVEIPDFSKEVPVGTKDRDMEIQRKGYYYNKEHYWDNTNFKDSALIRTPYNMLKNKLDKYFNDMVVPHPDSVYKESVNLIEKSRSNKAMFRYLVSYCFNYALESKIMGMDAAFVYIAKKYYVSGQADWIDKKTREKIEREVILTQYNLIGMKAQDLKMPTLDGDLVSLYETKAPFTLLVFWETDCGHCKKTVPLIKTQLLDKFKPHGFKVFAVHTQNKKEEWEAFITKHELFDFVQCWDPNGQNDYRVYYHIESTPMIYLLDKDKKIIGKKLDMDQLEGMLIQEYKKMGIEIEK